jgi:MFS family permease
MVDSHHRSCDHLFIPYWCRIAAFLGAAIDRFGARSIVSGGIVLLGAGTIGLSQASQPWQLFPCNLLMGLGWIAVSITAISVILAQRFTASVGSPSTLH